MAMHIRLPSRQGEKARATRLARDQSGTSVVEFAMVAPILAFMLIATVDLARGIGAKLSLEQSIYRTMEMATVGVVGSDYEYLRQEAANSAGVPLAQTTLEQWAQCGDNLAKLPFDTECGSSEMVARYVRIHVWRSHVPTFKSGWLGNKFASMEPDGTIRLQAESSLRVQ